MRRGLKQIRVFVHRGSRAARAAPYEKGTETTLSRVRPEVIQQPRARPPMEKGTETSERRPPGVGICAAASAAPYEKGTETRITCPWAGLRARRARGPL